MLTERWPHGCALLLLAAAGSLLWAVGSGSLAPPPLDPSALSNWVGDVGPPTAAVAILRLAGLALVAWLVAAVGLDALATAVRSARLARMAGAALPRPLRTALHRGVGLTFALGTLAVPPAPEQPAKAGHGAVMTVVPDGGVEWMQSVPDPDESDTDGTATMRALPHGATSGTATMRPLPQANDVGRSVAAAPGSSHQQVTVAPGDSLWRLAEEVVGERVGRPATDAEVSPYWQSLVEANRSRLRSGDPDVIFPGESVVLP